MEYLNNLRTGNFVNFQGRLGKYPFSVLVELTESRTEMQIYLLEHKKMKERFVGYAEHLRPIILRPEHIEKLGFQLNKNTGIYDFYQHSIGYHIYKIVHDDGHLTHVLPQMRVFNPMTPVPQNRGDVNYQTVIQNTIPMPFVHTMQNYFEDLGLQIDYSVLKDFQ